MLRGTAFFLVSAGSILWVFIAGMAVHDDVRGEPFEVAAVVAGVLVILGPPLAALTLAARPRRTWEAAAKLAVARTSAVTLVGYPPALLLLPPDAAPILFVLTVLFALFGRRWRKDRAAPSRHPTH